MKKNWTRPELAVLVRGSDEERVLEACKSSDSGNSQTAFNGYCFVYYGQGICRCCSSYANS